MEHNSYQKNSKGSARIRAYAHRPFIRNRTNKLSYRRHSEDSFTQIEGRREVKSPSRVLEVLSEGAVYHDSQATFSSRVIAWKSDTDNSGTAEGNY
ncbi:hypothetical protein V3C99_008721 [Haemonchus contortus]